jgi:transposase
MRAYSQDVRQRVLRAVDQGHTQAEIAKTFAISVATIKWYLKHRRETGHVEPKAIPGRPATKGEALQVGLRAQLEAHPDARLEDHCLLVLRSSLGLKNTSSRTDGNETSAAWRGGYC